MSDHEELTQHEEFMRLFVAHQPKIYSFIRSLVFNRHDAEEVLQDVVTVLWRRYDDFEPGTRFDRWAFQVAFNQVRSYRQRKSRDGLVFDDQLVGLVADQAMELHTRQTEFRDALDYCLQKLSPHDQSILRQRFEPGATNREVARKIKRSESAVSRRLNRIYGLLLQCINGGEAKEAIG